MIKAIIPKSTLINAADLKRAVREAIEREVVETQGDFEKTTASWRHDVDFTISAMPDGYEVSTDDDIYGYVDSGTKAHDIAPKRGKRLRFRVGGTPKTQPGTLGSTSGSRGGTVVLARKVRHPGTKARKFAEMIVKKHEKQLSVRLDRAISDTIDRG